MKKEIKNFRIKFILNLLYLSELMIKFVNNFLKKIILKYIEKLIIENKINKTYLIKNNN